MKQIQEKQGGEKKTAEEFDAELLAVGDDGFSVRLQRTVFTAETSEGADGRTIAIDERTEVDEFSTGFVEEHYLDRLPSGWEIVQELLAVDSIDITVTEVMPSPAITVPETVRTPQTAERSIGIPVPGHAGTDPRRLDLRPTQAQPYDRFEPDETGVYDPEQHLEEVEPVTGEPYMEMDGRAGNLRRTTEPVQLRDVVRPQATEPRYASRNAADVVQELFEQTGLDGTVEAANDYGVTDDFEGEVEEAYWIDIDGMDMDRTEYFINGELAEDSIENYDLGPGDSIAFVESDIFYSETPDDSYCSVDETLHLAELLDDDIDSIEHYTVPETSMVDGAGATYAAA